MGAGDHKHDKHEAPHPSAAMDIAPENMAGERSSSAVHADQLRILFAQAPIALAVNVIIAAMMAAALAQVAQWRDVALWLGAMFVTIALRASLLLWYRRAAKTGSPAHAWGIFSAFGSAVTGALWGFGGALLFPDAAGYRMLVALTIAGMCAGAVALNVSHFLTLLAFIVAAATPIAARFALEGTTPDEMLAGMMTVFAVALVLAGYKFNRSLVETLQLRSISLARRASWRRRISACATRAASAAAPRTGSGASRNSTRWAASPVA